MTDCHTVTVLLSEYVDHELPDDACSVLAEHLDRCERCREAAASLRRTVELCRRYRVDAAPGPLPPERQTELRRAFEKALGAMRERQS